jgi:hypothetical protein
VTGVGGARGDDGKPLTRAHVQPLYTIGEKTADQTSRRTCREPIKTCQARAQWPDQIGRTAGASMRYPVRAHATWSADLGTRPPHCPARGPAPVTGVEAAAFFDLRATGQERSRGRITRRSWLTVARSALAAARSSGERRLQRMALNGLAQVYYNVSKSHGPSSIYGKRSL